MKRILPFLYFLLSAGPFTAFGQAINITTTNTASICYNDGSLIIHATGGTAPYIDSILSGPSNPNLTYPIALPTGQDTFTDLPHGSFTIRVHDASGHSGTFTASVAGTYEFPTDTLLQHFYYLSPYGNFNTDTLFCIADSSSGRRPYQYALSSISANSGFGNYQNSNFFTGLCPEKYWVRLRDSCSNIFTSMIEVTYYPLSGGYYCYNYASGDVTLIALGGIPPYTFNIIESYSHTIVASNGTGVFSSLPMSTEYLTFSINDSCGDTYVDQYYAGWPFQPPSTFYTANCPFDGSIYNGGYNFEDAYPYIFTCLNCVPVQTDTVVSSLFSRPLFTGLQPDSTYVIRMEDDCGNVLIDSVTPAPTLNVSVANTSCRSVLITCRFNTGQYIGSLVPQTDIDSMVLIYNGIRYVSLNGFFFDLPPNNTSYTDTLEIFTNIGCNLVMPVGLDIPYIPIELEAAHNPNCDLVWDGLYTSASWAGPDSESFFFISGANDTTYGQLIPGGGGYLGYYFLQEGATYTIVSDSGCSFSARLPTVTLPDTVISYVNCIGQPVVTANLAYLSPYNNSCFYGIDFWSELPRYIIRFYRNDTLVYTASDTVLSRVYYYPTDTGLYTYKVYLTSTFFNYRDSQDVLHYFNIGTIYDSICPVDSGSLYVTESSVPFPYVQTAYACYRQLVTPPLLTIYGGSIPYTVQIAGLDTFIMNTNTSVFPETALGVYNIIAYDNCGISRSFTFSIIDTCSHCPMVPVTHTIYDTICHGAYLIYNYNVYENSGSYTVTLQNAQTCDSIVTLDLYVYPAIDVSVYDSICPGDYVTIGNVSYARQGVYTNTLSSTLGCDSTVTLYLTVLPTSVVSIYDTICQGENVMVGVNIYDQTGAYSDTLSNLAGCDSVVSLYLFVHPVLTTVEYDSICQGNSVKIGAHIYTQTGSYTDTIANEYGCDSIVTINLTVYPTFSVTLSDTVCQGDSVTIGDSVYSQTGTYTDTLTSAHGCDSVVTLNLTVYPSYFADRYDSICEGSSVSIGGHIYTHSGTYSNPLTSILGCDSVIILNLIVYPTSTIDLHDSICQGDTVTLGSHSYSQPGIYSDTIIGTHGCDNITTLSLFVYPRFSTFLTDTICQGTSVSIGSDHYTQPGIYTDTLSSIHGCDSVVTLDLSLRPVEALILSDSICWGASVRIGTSDYQQTGSYTDTLNNIHGCDSIVTLNLLVYPVSNVMLLDSICQGSSVSIGVHSYTQTGYYTDTLSGVHGCDSVVRLGLTVHPTSSFSMHDSICQGDSISLAGHIYRQAGNYNDTLAGVYGCDSIINLDLLVYTPFTNSWSYTHTGYTYFFRDSIISGDGPFTYLWNFGDGSPTSDSADPVHTYTNGVETEGKFNVTLIVTGPCGSDSMTEILDVSGINDISLSSHVSIYPDPNQGSFAIAVNGISSGGLTAEITDLVGRSIYSQGIHTGENKFDLHLASGVYLVIVSDGVNETVRRMSIR